MVRISELSNFVVPGYDVVSGDVIEILDSGSVREFDNRTILQIRVRVPSGKEKLLALNRTSQKNLADEYGDDTQNWIYKKAIVTVSEQNVRGEMRKVIYLNAVKGE